MYLRHHLCVALLAAGPACAGASAPARPAPPQPPVTDPAGESPRQSTAIPDRDLTRPPYGTTSSMDGIFGARHLVVQYRGAMKAARTTTRTTEEARLRAEEAARRAKSGARFEDLVAEYSDEPGAANRGGSLGTFRRGVMVPTFQDALEQLGVGEVSGVVESPFGFHVILRTK